MPHTVVRHQAHYCADEVFGSPHDQIDRHVILHLALGQRAIRCGGRAEDISLRDNPQQLTSLDDDQRSAVVPHQEVNDILHLKLPVEEAHTIGGFVANRLRRIPHEGDFIEEQEYHITVIEADARSVLKVKMERI